MKVTHPVKPVPSAPLATDMLVGQCFLRQGELVMRVNHCGVQVTPPPDATVPVVNLRTGNTWWIPPTDPVKPVEGEATYS